MSRRSARRAASLAATIAALFSTATLVVGQSGAKNGEWRSWGADGGMTHYSPLDQITRENVKDLKIAWRWKTENFGPGIYSKYENTPLMVGGVLYTTAGMRRDVVAIDAATGETLWMFRYDEGSRGQRAPNRTLSGRGVAYWTDGKGDERIIYVSLGYRLVALNAKTGRPIPTFGTDGVVDLYEGLEQPQKPPPTDGQLSWGSAPALVGDVLVVGAALQSLAPQQEFIAGFPRGFDVRTGKRLWTFHTIPRPGDFGSDTWEDDSWSYTGNTGVWTSITVDEELGRVYLPVESATNDLYGGHRPGNNVFANSLVCLDAKTGKRIWHFQLTHHDIWDYDISAPPTLIDITVNGRRIKAIAQVTKQAFTYVFDRVTGEPVWPIVERPVPKGDVPGEWYSPTQPFPTKPAAYDRQGVTLDDLLDLTAELKAQALEIAKDYRLGPIFTPPPVAGANGKKGTLALPNLYGGTSWHGSAADPETGYLYVPSTTQMMRLSLVQDVKRNKMNYISGGGGAEILVQGLPLVKPPWSRITAIDLNTGDHVWMISSGAAPEYIRNHPALKGVDLSNAGSGDIPGLLVTKTLLFAGEGSGLHGVPPGSGGPMFRAIDKKTGEVIWQFKLPAHQSGLPMTYMVNGKQYIVVAVGAPNVAAELVALALP